MQLCIFLIFYLAMKCSAFLPRSLWKPRNEFYTSNNNIPLQVKSKSPILNELTGFYGLIGPNMNFYNASSLIELFTGDGIIQGVFFNKGNITFVSHIIETEKVKFERVNGIIPKNFISLILYALNLLPVSQGVANTAMINFSNTTLALHETDHPYSLNIDFNKQRVTTLEKLRVRGMNSVSGHTKVTNSTLITLDYDILNRFVNVVTTDHDLNIIQRIPVKTTYLPVIHDFINTDKYVIFIDSPLTIQLKNILNKAFPVALANNLPTYIHVISKKSLKVEKYTLSESFYAFHLGKFIETRISFRFGALEVDNLDFSTLLFQPKLREIIIDKKSGFVRNKSYKELEKIDMDFAQRIDDTRTLYNLIGPIGFYGFAICKDFQLLKKITFDQGTILGEPQIIEWNDTPYVIGFIKTETNCSLLVMNLNNYDQETIYIPLSITEGFHSIFIKN